MNILSEILFNSIEISKLLCYTLIVYKCVFYYPVKANLLSVYTPGHDRAPTIIFQDHKIILRKENEMLTERITVKGKEYELIDSTVQANGQRIHYVELGSGPMVLLVHGFPEIWYSWKNQIVALAEAGFRAVAIDTRGVGRSSKPQDWTDYTLDKLAKDVAEVVTALGEEKAVVVGHDWGSIISWTEAWLYPEKFAGVVGISNTFGGRDTFALPLNKDRTKLPTQVYEEIGGEDKWFYSHQFYKVEPALVTMEDPKSWLYNGLYAWSHMLPKPPILEEVYCRELTDEQIVTLFRSASVTSPKSEVPKPSVRLPFPNPDFLPEEDLERLAASWEASTFRYGLYYYKAVDLNHQLLGGIEERIKIPALYIGGDRDWVTIWSRDALDRLPEICDDLRGCVVLENCGHWEEIEEPDKVSDLIIDFAKNL